MKVDNNFEFPDCDILLRFEENAERVMDPQNKKVVEVAAIPAESLNS